MDDYIALITLLMKQRGMSQSDLSRMSEIPTSTLSRYLEGKDIPASRLKVIAAALDVTVDEILGITPKLSDDERELVRFYRMLTDKGKHAVLAGLRDFAYTREEESREEAE